MLPSPQKYKDALSCFGPARTPCPPFRVYIHGSWTPAKQYGIKKNEVLLGTSYKTHRERGEHIGNRKIWFRLFGFHLNSKRSMYLDFLRWIKFFFFFLSTYLQNLKPKYLLGLKTSLALFLVPILILCLVPSLFSFPQ
jgi:hypothetical protein